MKKNLFKRGMAGLLSLVMCLTALVGIGTTTAYAAGERAEVYLVSFPRSGDANIDYSGTWGHPNLRYMNGWHSGESKYTTIRAMHSYDGNICYCIEPGVRQDTGDTYTSKDETFWDNLPSDINSTISPYDMKLFIGRIMQYGYTGPISTSWRSQNPADAATLAEAMATQVLIWETVVGERDEDFDYVSPGSYDAVKGVISTAHPLYSQFISYYNSIEASVQRHSAIQYTETKFILPEYTELFTQNSDMVGWITIEDTKINYPVMQSKNEPNFYLKHGFDKAYTDYGCPYVQENCDVQEPSDNLIIYGHHMNDGSMFAGLMKFTDKEFWEQHKRISFNTLTDVQEYEVIAVFKTFVYSDSPDSFKYYHFVDAENEDEFNAYVEKCRELSLYDTGVSAEYGDKLISLSTCEYSRANGRLVVVAKLVK